MNYYYICKTRQEQIDFLTYLEDLDENYHWQPTPTKPTDYIPADYSVNWEHIIFTIEGDCLFFDYYSKADTEYYKKHYEVFPYQPNPYNF